MSNSVEEATLQQIKQAQGIDKSITEMTQAEKAQLRYIALLTQNQAVQGDMARTETSAANSIRILKEQFNILGREVGNIFIPALMQIVPVVTAVVKVLTNLAKTIAGLFHFELPDLNWDSVGTGTSAVGGLDDTLKDATSSAKDLKRQLAGFDELNNLTSPSQGSGSGGDNDGSSGAGFNLDLPGYDMLKDAAKKTDELTEKAKELTAAILSLGAALAAIKISADLAKFIEWLKSIGGGISITGLLGLASFIADLNEFKKYVKDFLDNGPTFDNVSGMISNFLGMISDAFLMFGKTKLAGVLEIFEGIARIVKGAKSIADEGVNWDNVKDVADGIGDVVAGIALITGNIKVAAIIKGLQGIYDIITELRKNWDAIKQGDWSGVDKVKMIADGVMALFGAVSAIILVHNAIKGISKVTKDKSKFSSATESVASVSEGTSTLTSTLKNLAKNLGWGILILAEVSAAAILFVGAIYVLGLELQKVIEAWQPVISNLNTVGEALGLGAALMLTVGIVTTALGAAGGELALTMGIGIAILLELGVATGLFIAEIWAIGWRFKQNRRSMATCF